MSAAKGDAVKATVRPLRGVTQWEVWHPEGADYGLRPQRYGSRREAAQRAREWNKDLPGHVVRPVLPNDSGLLRQVQKGASK